MPLFDYTLLPPTLSPNVWPFHTSTPLITADTGGVVVSPLALHLTPNQPACYETAVGSLVCLGQVKNNFEQPVENIVVVVQLVAENGTPLATSEAFVSRWILPVGESGPYRVLFTDVPPGYAGAQVIVKTGEIAHNVERRYADLELRQVSGTFVLDQYQISLSVINNSDITVQNLTVTMVLLDNQGLVTGFRQTRIGADRTLVAGEVLALTMRVVPQGADTVAFEAFAEGYIDASR